MTLKKALRRISLISVVLAGAHLTTTKFHGLSYWILVTIMVIGVEVFISSIVDEGDNEDE